MTSYPRIAFFRIASTGQCTRDRRTNLHQIKRGSSQITHRSLNNLKLNKCNHHANYNACKITDYKLHIAPRHNRTGHNRINPIDGLPALNRTPQRQVDQTNLHVDSYIHLKTTRKYRQINTKEKTFEQKISKVKMNAKKDKRSTELTVRKSGKLV